MSDYPDRPNILLILTDQQRADTVAALGNNRIRTPNLDSLVREGVAFTQAYSPSPVCVPARACLQYSQYPGKTGCLDNIHPTTRGEQDSYADVLSRNGYETIGIGKCHFLPDRQALRGFKRRLTQEEAPKKIEDDDYLQFIQKSPYRNVRDVHGTWREMIYMPQTSPLDEAHHPTQWVGDRTIDFINEQAEEDKPWMAFCSFIHPHPPYAPPVPWDMMYSPDDMEDPHLPDDFQARQPAFQRAGLHEYYFDPPTSNTLWRMVKARYYACVSFVDYQVGRIVNALRDSGQLQNTLIIFSSDHGEMLGDLGLIGKGNMYNASSRVPLIMRWGDGRHAGSQIETPVTLVDIGSTILCAAGLGLPAEFDGIDLAETIGHPERFERRIVFSQVFNPDRGIYMSTDGRFKYIHSAPDASEELYDMREDPLEDINLFRDPQHQEKIQELRDALFDYLESTEQNHVLEYGPRRWRDWPPEVIQKPRTKSNDPCLWWEAREREVN